MFHRLFAVILVAALLAGPAAGVPTVARAQGEMLPALARTGGGLSSLCSLDPCNIISGLVYEDKNANGVRDEGEHGTGKVIVRLYADADGDGLPGVDDLLLAEARTDQDGAFTFSVSEGDFVLQVDPESLPKRHVLTTPNHQSAAFDGLGLTDEGNDFGHQKARFKDDELLAKFVPGTPQETMTQVLKSYKLKVRAYNTVLEIYTLKTKPGEVEAMADALEADPCGCVLWAEPNYAATPAYTPNDPDYSDPNKVYAPQKINAPAAWDVTRGTAGTVVAVLDSGLSFAHPEFAGVSLVRGADYVYSDNSPDDDNGHGTHVTGILAAAMDNEQGIAGIAPGVKVAVLKVIDADGGCFWSEVIAGITDAVNVHGARIINLSLGGTSGSNALREAVQYAASHNVLVVAAAGNYNTDAPFYPAYYDETLAVSATDAADQRYTTSNYGSYVDLAAPGGEIWSTYWLSGDPATYGRLSGTSMAAAHVSGVAALLLSANPNLSAADLRTILQQSAADLGAAGWDPYFGAGRLDAGAAMALVAGEPRPTPTPTPTPYAQAINSGGPTFTDNTGNLWAADQAFQSGGWGYTNASSTAKSSSTAVNGTVDDPLYQTWRDNPGEYRFTVPNGTYQVTLKFAEFEVTKSNSRVMKIAIEGVVVENALDVYKLAGKATALDRVYVVDVSDGILNVAFTKASGTKNPMVSAVGVMATTRPAPTPTPSPTPTLTPPPGGGGTSYSKRVNSGGPDLTDGQGATWLADRAYAAGAWGYTGGTAKSTTSAVAGTTDDALYQKWRESPGEYKFDVPNGTYQVTLKFAEFEVSKAGDRKMRITIEGAVVEDALDIYAVVGKATALDRTYQATVSDGVLNIAFAKNGGRKNPVVSALYVRP